MTCFTTAFWATVLLSALQLSSQNNGNDQPIVGILTQEIKWSVLTKSNPELPLSTTYIASSYVKSVEASGGRVIPVFTNRSLMYYTEVVMQVNGILIPGGGADFTTDYGIGRSVDMIFKVAKIINTAGDYFPILGICLGFELLLLSSNKGVSPLTKCRCNNLNTPLNLISDMEAKSVLFQTMPNDIKDILLSEPVTANHHGWCMTRKNLTSTGLDSFWNAITINNDKDGLEFISTIEGIKYPFIGLQFHPEKNAYEWERGDPHNWDAIITARYFYDFFLNKCRKNKHKYFSKKKLKRDLIYNYQQTYVGNVTNAMFEQVYFFSDGTIKTDLEI
ncbi:gamma-glutamyl hydrolase A-like [Adelges cooleyi]|uniref:gamma-glutamyl hydrolase A-like n=1 Tax=Adelges cooleyi TaxID=133065 RepID=UPI0021801D67|nr:gamma-glutamyl hydrolase A-like [Adelges cooleyi]